MEKHLGIMLDCSRNAVMKPEAVKRYIDQMAKMGYDTLMLYTEDTYEVDGHPYFGHLRGRYSKEELKEMDAYAREKGVELCPCIQTLAHLNAIFRWPQYDKIRDCHDILCAGEPEVYALIEDMFSTLEECFSSRLVNIGMDEAEFVGLGKYMAKHGVEDRLDILLDHLGKVEQIAKRHGFRILMWGDMFFKLMKDADAAYVRERVPEGTGLIYWDYYSTDRAHYDARIAKYQQLDRPLWFAGGLWTWVGYSPKLSYSLGIGKPAAASCLANGVEDVILTVWGDDGAECSRFSVLPAMFAAAEYFRGNFDDASIREKFQAQWGISFEDAMLLELPGTPSTCGGAEAVCNPEKYMLYNDFLSGAMDSTVSGGEGVLYGACAEKLKPFISHPEYGILYREAYALCRLLEKKYTVGTDTRKAYLSGDKDALAALLPVYEDIEQRIGEFYEALEARWMWENKPQGMDVLDIRIGGLLQRCKHARKRLKEHIDGALERVEELEAPVLDVEGGGRELPGKPIRFRKWSQAASVNVFEFKPFK